MSVMAGPRGLWDVVELFGAGVLVCVVLIAGLWLADKYHVNSIWPAAAWATMLFIPTVAPTFARQGRWKRPAFLLFFGLWMGCHGLIVASLIKWVSFLYWFPIILVEGFAGYLIADWLFGIAPLEDGG